MCFISILIYQSDATALWRIGRWFFANLYVPIGPDESPHLVCLEDAPYRRIGVAEAHTSSRSGQSLVQFYQQAERCQTYCLDISEIHDNVEPNIIHGDLNDSIEFAVCLRFRRQSDNDSVL